MSARSHQTQRFKNLGTAKQADDIDLAAVEGTSRFPSAFAGDRQFIPRPAVMVDQISDLTHAVAVADQIVRGIAGPACQPCQRNGDVADLLILIVAAAGRFKASDAGCG
jgi:hypothetical protein